MTLDDFMDRVEYDTNGGCWLWARAADARGYGSLLFNGRVTGTHRVSYILHKGEIPPGMLVCHKCDNPPCCNPDHLFLGTYRDNSVDMHRKGRANQAFGADAPMAKLSAADVSAIRARYQPPPRYRRGGNPNGLAALAKQYGVSTSTIFSVVSRLSWTKSRKFNGEVGPTARARREQEIEG